MFPKNIEIDIGVKSVVTMGFMLEGIHVIILGWGTECNVFEEYGN